MSFDKKAALLRVGLLNARQVQKASELVLTALERGVSLVSIFGSEKETESNMLAVASVVSDASDLIADVLSLDGPGYESLAAMPLGEFVSFASDVVRAVIAKNEPMFTGEIVPALNQLGAAKAVVKRKK